MRWQQNLPLMLTFSNIKNAVPINHALKQTQSIKNQQSLIISANFVRKMVTLYKEFLNKKRNIVKSILNLDNNIMLNLSLLHRKCLKNFWKKFWFYQTIVLLVFSPHKTNNRSSSQSPFPSQIIPQVKNLLQMIIETDIISPPTIF